MSCFGVWSFMACWSSSLVLGGHGQGISKLCFVAAASKWQETAQVVDKAANISMNKVRKGSYTDESAGISSAWWRSVFLLASWWRMGKVGLRRCLNKPDVEVCRHRYHLRLPPLVRGRNLWSDGEPISSMRCGRACTAPASLKDAPVVLSLGAMVAMQEVGGMADGESEWCWSLRTCCWSNTSATPDGWPTSMAMSWPFKPERLPGVIATSFVRPSRLAAEGVAGTETSGFVPVEVHGCSVLVSVLLGGEEGGLDCVSIFFSEAFLTNVKDLYVIFLFHGVLCNHVYLHRCL